MGWKDRVFQNFRLYAVTDLREEGAGILRKIDRAYRGGVDIIQLRSKVLTDAALVRLGLRIGKIAAKHRKLFFVNDRVDLALATGADGVHLGQEDMPVPRARKIAARAKAKLWIGKSTHSLRQAIEAEREGVDYIGVGPVFATPTKPLAKSVGLRLVGQAAAKVRVPWVAIGGIDSGNLSEVLAAGATRVAVVRAVFAATDACYAARQLRNQIEGN